MRTLVSVAALVTVLSVPLPALAHGDERLVDASFDLAPGASAGFDGEVHYHRIVGRFTADEPIAVRMIDPATGVVRAEAGPGRDLAVNELIRCCDGAAWTKHRLEIENRGHSTTRVQARATLVHDDLAVMVYRAESGTAESVVVMGAIWIAVLRRIHRRDESVSSRKATGTFAVLVGAVLALATYGAVRYGAGSAPGLVAGLADAPVLPVNPIVSRSSLLLGLGMVGWAVAGTRWAKARTRMDRRRWLALGWSLVGAVVATGALIGAAYDVAGMPLAMTLVASVPVITVMVLGGRTRPDPHRTHLAGIER